MGKTMKFALGIVAASTMLVSCGGSSDSSGRTRNATIGDENARCITAAPADMDTTKLEVTFCEEALLATVFYGESSAEADADSVGVPVSRKWSPNRDLTGISSIRIQTRGTGEDEALFDETIDLTFEDLTAKSCAEGGACKVGDEAPKGGRVFYVADTPQPWGTYLAILPRLSERVKFECNEVVIADTKDGIGQGQSNTQKISDACGDTSPVLNAVKAAGTTTYLPTRAEIVLAAKNLIGVDGFDLSANQANGYPRPAVSDMPIAGVDGVSAIEVNRRARTVDFFAYPNWSHMEVMRTMSDLAIWPVYPFSPGKIAITAVSVRPTPTDSSATETPTTIGNGPGPVCNISEADIIDNAGGDYTTGDLPKTFECADVNRANFTGRDLSNLSFRTANVARANFTNANLSSADFTNANCTGTIFTGATLTGATFTGDLCPQPSTEATPSSAEDIDAVTTACRDSDVVPQILGEERTTDAPVQVVLEQGCDIPTSLSNKVRVFYDVVVSGQKHFVDWGTEHEIREISPTTLQQVLPADSYRLVYTRWVLVERDNEPQTGVGRHGSFQFEVKEGQTVSSPACSLSDLTFENSTLNFPCSATPNLAVTHATWDGDTSRIEGAQGRVNLESIPAGWQRISLTMSGELVNNSWAFLGCHTKCGPVAADANYRITKSDGTVSVNVPKCSASETRTNVGYLTPLFKAARGLLHVPTMQLNQDALLTSFESPTKGFYVLQRDVTITMSKSDLMAGVLFSESEQCIAGVNPSQLSIFEPTVDDVTKIELPQAETSYPVIINTANLPSAPIVVPEGTTSVSVTIAYNPSTNASVELSLDGDQWLPIVVGQATRVSVDEGTKLNVRTIDKNGLEVVTIHEVMASDSPNVLPTSPAGSSGQDELSTKNSTNYTMILLLALVLILILLVIKLFLNLVRK